MVDMTLSSSLTDHGPSSATHAERQRWMAVLARADATKMADLLRSCSPIPGWKTLRGPESGLVMVRGRAGGGGAPFNLGEVSVTRCTVRTDAGAIGHAYITGRDAEKVKLAALIDALLQEPARTTELQQHVIGPLETIQRERRETTARKAAATRVQFFTLASMRT
jgi:alpha-D-ribose 1-methylphosphonate 5-triphosphate synthase subunit PhnG